MTSSAPIRVLVVEDHAVVRAGLVTMIGLQADMTVAGEAKNGKDAVEAFQRLRPSVTLMDLRLPVMDGLEATRAIRALEPEARVVVLTTYEGDEDFYRAIETGALGYLVKDATREEMLQAIRAVASGRRWIASGVALRVAEQYPRLELTPREREVLGLMAQGLSNREIGESLSIAEATVKVHASAILGRLGARDRTHAVVVALRRGLLHPEDLSP